MPCPRLVAIVAILPLLWQVGCNRQYYRQQADQAVQRLVAEKARDLHWKRPPFSAEVDPRSRYYDPYDDVTPPMPIDDPVSHRYMQWIDDKKAWPHWDEAGYRTVLENPQWQEQLAEYVEVEDGEVQLSLPAAVQLAYIHSPDYQQQLESLYLSALDVSTERFRLDTQFFGGVDTTYNHSGSLRGPGGESNTLTVDSDLRTQRRLATAGQILVGFANSMVWQFAGPNTNATTSLLNFSLVQPLLRGAGRDVALEQLTIVERGLLANLRAFERYRLGFYTNVAIGENGVSGVQRRGGFFGGTGLTGFTGTGAGGLGGVGAATGFGRGGFGAGGAGGGGGGAGFAGGGAGQVGGYIGLLQTLQEIRNQRVSLESQLRTLALLEANLEAGIIDLTQVDQFRQNIETERATLLQAENGYENSLENFTVGTLGLPPDLEVALDDSLVEQFQFIDQTTTAVQVNLERLQDELGRFVDPPDEATVYDLFDRIDQRLQEVRSLRQGIANDVAMLMERLPLRRLQMTASEQQMLDRDVVQLQASLQGLSDRIDLLEPELMAIQQRIDQQTTRQTLDELVVWLRSLISTVQELALVQARARVESVVLQPVELESELAFHVALTHRLDIRNNRAALVDSWRLIQFNADALQSNLDVFFTGDMNTVGDNPLDFRGSTGSLRAGIEFDAPFQRLLERNNFRQALIDYQQDRRQLIQFFDSVQLSLRSLLRSMEQLQVNMEIQRRAVVIAIRRVDLTREELNEPTAPPEPGQAATQLGPTAALNLLTALSDLRSTQNNFMSVWLNYYANRMRLMRDLGLMKLDDQGLWVDISLEEALEEVSMPSAEKVNLPPAVPGDWMDEAYYPVPPTRRLPAVETQVQITDQIQGPANSPIQRSPVGPATSNR